MMTMFKLRGCCFLLLLATGYVSAGLSPTRYPNTTLRYRGVNLSGAEWSGNNYKPFAPVVSDMDTFTLAGANIARFPIGWEGVQPALLSPLSNDYLNTVVPVVEGLLAEGHSVLLDLHNYMRYNKTIVNAAQLADVWSRLLAKPSSEVTMTFADAATRYGGDGAEQGPQLILGLMNEPHTMSSSVMLANYNLVLKTIRSLGFHSLVFLEGNGWTGLHSWTAGSPPNSQVFTREMVQDPADHWAVGVHQYFDTDSSGQHAECITPAEFPSKINFDAFANYLASTNIRAFLSEFGAAYNANCGEIEATMLSLVANHSVGSAWAEGSSSYGFLGFTTWAAGHAWGDKYFMGVNPGGPAQALMATTFPNVLTPPAGACDAPGYLLAFNSTPPAISSGYSCQLHNADWSAKETIGHSNENGGPPSLVCVTSGMVAAGQDEVALYDHTGKQFVCSSRVNAANPVLDLSTCLPGGY